MSDDPLLALTQRLVQLERRLGQTEVSESPYGFSRLAPTTILLAGQASIALALPSGYATFRVEYQGRGENASTSVALFGQLNADTGANYDRTFNQVANSANAPTTQMAQTSMRLGILAAASAAAGLNGAGWFELPHADNTSLQRHAVYGCSARLGTAAADMIHEHGSGDWRSTNAATSLLLFPSTGNFAAGTRVTLYGERG